MEVYVFVDGLLIGNYSGGEPVFVEDNIFEISIPLVDVVDLRGGTVATDKETNKEMINTDKETSKETNKELSHFKNV